jgi:hypothetical protein
MPIPPPDDDLYRAHQRERARVRAIHDSRGNGVPHDRRHTSTAQKVTTGAVLASMIYLVTSCFYSAKLDRPKIERHDFRFNHQPLDPYNTQGSTGGYDGLLSTDAASK